ncbi:LA2681 family HEPN domain-containing protein [Bradyrhizobium sp. CCGB12]|uniref:LA2681 family HEPN domain-containing protein n=1 Tax=Bradyrhizobium sp. CCGB12 TaxID=2949632 RepID=UPI0035C016DE
MGDDLASGVFKDFRGPVTHSFGGFPSYGLAVEKVKAAYRTAYSIFDKDRFISQ